MTVLPLRIYGDPCLAAVSTPVESFDGELERLAADMAESMYQYRGIGLAAPQVGVNCRLFIMDLEWVDEEDGPPTGRRNLRVFVNPEIAWESPEDCMMLEGCLSLPKLEGEVYRPKRVRLRWADTAGAHHEAEMGDLEARCVQHEIDHLDGRLFIDRMSFVKRRLLAGQLRQIKQGAHAAAAS